MDTSKKYLKYVFSEDEKKEISAGMAQNISKKTSLEDEKKAVADDFKSMISRAENEISSAATKINNGYELRNIECEIVKDFDEKVIRYKRLDTGEIVDIKAMTNDDLQQEMFEEKEE